MTLSTAPIRVLVADDEAHMRRTIKAIIESLGGRVVAESADGEAAVTRFAEVRPDIVILDIDMPRLPGDRALERLRVIDPSVNAIMMSAQDTIGSVRRCLDLGARGYILKSNPAEEIFRLFADAWAECVFHARKRVAA